MSPQWAGIPGKETLVPGLSVPDKPDLELPEKVKGNFLEVEALVCWKVYWHTPSLSHPSFKQASDIIAFFLDG